ncbi:MAG: hypothetical protein JRJ60_14975 [Deltaproteobacteria bacterium]|nr:hypothetical protein [Deltaproteobacteria bacterium]
MREAPSNKGIACLPFLIDLPLFKEEIGLEKLNTASGYSKTYLNLLCAVFAVLPRQSEFVKLHLSICISASSAEYLPHQANHFWQAAEEAGQGIKAGSRGEVFGLRYSLDPGVPHM